MAARSAPRPARVRCVALDAMGVMFRAADDVDELLVPFVRDEGGIDDAVAIRLAYVEASLGAIDADAFWTRVGLDASVEDAYLSRHSLTSGLLEFLHVADAESVPVWCLSNDVARWSAKLRAAFGIEDLLAGAVISSDAGARKPDHAIYRALLERCGCEPRDLLFVDDRPANVAAAHALDIAAMVFDGEDAFGRLCERLAEGSE